MEILSYPVGLLIGLFPVIVDLGGSAQPAELLLDGKPACTISARAPACTVDLGPDPFIHRLELVRRDRAGRVAESVVRWVNKPGVEAEIHASGRCEKKTRSCDFTITWAHPGKLDPSALTVALDGLTVSRTATSTIRVPFPGEYAPQVVTADAVFPDGRRASFTRLLQGAYPERVEASLQAVPIVVAPGIRDEDLAASLKEAGWPVRAVELGEFEVDFVIEPGALESRSAFGLSQQSMPLEDAEEIRAIVASDTITAFTLLEATGMPANPAPGSSKAPGNVPGLSEYGSRAAAPARRPLSSWIRGLFQAPSSVPAMRRLLTSDAVAAAGYHLGGSPRRRAVVLIAGSTRPDESTFSPEQARSYLGQTLVPLFVWRANLGLAQEWPEGALLQKFGPNIATLKLELDRQRIVWLEGRVDLRSFNPRLPRGVEIAGRSLLPEPSTEVATPGAEDAVFAVASDPASPRTVYAGTRNGLRVSRDGGEQWSAVRTGSEPAEVYSVVFDPRGRDLLFGSGGSIGKSLAGGESWALVPTLAVFSFAVDPREPEVAIAATRGGVFQTADGGALWRQSSKGMEKTFALALAADRREAGVFYAATAGSGVFQSADAGLTWKPAGRELERTVVRCLAVDPAGGDSLYAGTDGGIFISPNRGKTWERRSSGLPRAVVYALAVDPADTSRIFAGTAAGIFESRDAAKSWMRLDAPAARAQITSLDFDPSTGRLLAGTFGHGVLVLHPPR